MKVERLGSLCQFLYKKIASQSVEAKMTDQSDVSFSVGCVAGSGHSSL